MRGNGPAQPDVVIAEVRRMLGWEPLLPATPHPAEVIPPDAPANPSETARLLRSLK